MIHGIDVDSQGRCAHWHSERDVVANMCGACGHMMTHAEYGISCPSCGHPFNPGCKTHEDVYFLPVR